MRLLLVVQLMLMHQNVTHGLNGPVSITPSVSYHVLTRNVFVRITYNTKSYPGITTTAVVFLVSSDTNSCPRVATAGSLNVKPLMLQLTCKEASEPIKSFHASRPSEVARCCPSAISECRESAFWSILANLIRLPTFIPTKTLEKGVSQYVTNLVPSESKPVSPPWGLNVLLSLYKASSKLKVC